MTQKIEWPPNYIEIYQYRQNELVEYAKTPQRFHDAKAYYAKHPAAFISTWGDTYDPRHAGQSPWKPFVLFPKQIELIEFLHLLIETEAPGLVEKSRDLGATWLGVWFSIWMWLFRSGSAIGWGSRKQELVDRIGDPDSIFEKIRMSVRRLPFEFRPNGFVPDEHLNFMKVVNPETDASITGEVGDNIGRGGRKTAYFKDESAHYEHPESIEAALTDNTNVQIDISSVFGVGTVFERKRNAGLDWAPGQPVVKGRTNVFVFDWRDHPEKTQEWYERRRKQSEDEGLLHIFAQEVDRDYTASLEGVVIPSLWVKSAIDAHVVLGFDDSGGWTAGLDVADGGGDTNSIAMRKGVVLKSSEEWGDRDTGFTTRRAVDACRNKGPMDLYYDCIGVGSGVKAESNRLASEDLLPEGVRVVPWNAGAEVLHKDQRFIRHDKQSPLNGDLFANMKAQAWWNLRRRFELTHRAVRSLKADATPDEKAFTWDAGDLISLPSTLPQLRKIEKELSQATISMGSRLKMVVDKTPDGAKSPNRADAIVMAYWPTQRRIHVSAGVIARASVPQQGRMGVRRRPRLI